MSLAACSSGGPQDRIGNKSAGVNDVLESGMAAADSENVTASTETGTQVNGTVGKEMNNTGGTDGVDVDLTNISSTMIYSEVFNIVSKPNEYKGKIIKMKGVCSVYNSEDTGKTYYSCIIKDATACCAQGIEFSLSDEYKYPDDYPEKGSEICVVGTFDTYKEDVYEYSILKDAELLDV